VSIDKWQQLHMKTMENCVPGSSQLVVSVIPTVCQIGNGALVLWPNPHDRGSAFLWDRNKLRCSFCKNWESVEDNYYKLEWYHRPLVTVYQSGLSGYSKKRSNQIFKPNTPCKRFRAVYRTVWVIYHSGLTGYQSLGKNRRSEEFWCVFNIRKNPKIFQGA
jgi:hypothetical protein